MAPSWSGCRPARPEDSPLSDKARATKVELIEENAALRRRLAGLEELLVEPHAPTENAANTAAYHRLLEAAGSFALELDERFAITHVTPSVQAVLGYTPDEMIHRGDPEWVHPEDRDQLLERFAKLITSGGSEVISCRLRHKNGRWKPFELVVSAYRNREGALKMVGQVRDISSRSKMDLSLRETRERSALVDAMSRDMVLLITNAAG